MPRAGLSPGGVLDAALAIVDESGADGLTLAAVAARTGVATPSLYKHVNGLPAVRRALRLRVLGELTALIRDAVAGRSGADAVRGLADAYRGYLRRYPHRFRLVEDAPDPADEQLAAASSAIVEVVFDVLRGYGLVGEHLVHATRGLRAAVGGFVRLEAGGGFGMPQDVDASFRYLVDLYLTGLTHHRPTPRR